jgi:hypothetical protein
MSSLRIGLVAEGSTDVVIIEAALNGFLDRRFVLSLLQPEATQPHLGAGWTGVAKWCHHAALRYQGDLNTDPTLSHFDLLIIHLDVDVTGFSYDQGGEPLRQLALTHHWQPLPTACICPPIDHCVTDLQRVLSSWLHPAVLGAKSVLCLPAQSSGTWLAAAVLDDQHHLIAEPLECNAVEDQLPRLRRKQRIKKNKRDYQAQAHLITEHWQRITTKCRQAQQFQADVLAAII